MDDFVFTFLKSAASLWGIFILLLIYAYKKGLSFTRQEKKSFALITVLLVGILSWFVFFEDVNSVSSAGKKRSVATIIIPPFTIPICADFVPMT